MSSRRARANSDRASPDRDGPERPEDNTFEHPEGPSLLSSFRTLVFTKENAGGLAEGLWWALCFVFFIWCPLYAFFFIAAFNESKPRNIIRNLTFITLVLCYFEIGPLAVTWTKILRTLGHVVGLAPHDTQALRGAARRLQD